ncbi:hypothetical protein ACFQVA_18690 [Actinomadura keratinilytica]
MVSRDGDILFATCSELEKLARPGTVRGCVDGRPLALHDPFAHTEDTKQPGTTHLVKLRNEAGQAAGSARFTVPEETVTFAAVQPSALSSALLLVPPNTLPPGFTPHMPGSSSAALPNPRQSRPRWTASPGSRPRRRSTLSASSSSPSANSPSSRGCWVPE